MPVIIARYDAGKVESVKRFLQREHEKGKSRDYEILIDGFRVISRTNNPEEFDDFEQELSETSRNLTILVYDGAKTNRNTRYSFSFSDEDVLNQKSAQLSGIGSVDKLVEQQLKEKERDRELELTKEALAASDTKLKQCEEYVTLLEGQIAEFKSKSFADNLNMGEVLKSMVGAVIRDNAHKLPAGEALAGLFGGPPTTPELPQSSDNSQNTFQKKQAAEIDQMTRNRLEMIADFQKKLDEPHMAGLFTVIQLLTDRPEFIQPTIDSLNQNR